MKKKFLFSLSHQHILITGASSGIGAGLALYYAAHDITLSLWGRDENRLKEIASKAEKKGATVKIYRIDLQQTKEALSLFRKIDQEQPVDMLINSAGLAGVKEDDEFCEKGENAYTVSMVNFTTPVALSCEAGKNMAKRRRGKIILIGSVAAYHDLPLSSVYCGSKAGLGRFGTALHAALEPFNVAVTVIAPGFVETPMSQALGKHIPFVVPLDKAVQKIVFAIVKGKPVFIFPWFFHITRWIEILLPYWLLHKILRLIEWIQYRQNH